MSSQRLDLGKFAQGFEPRFDHFIRATAPAEPRLAAAIRYSCLNGGKRIRPFLVIESARLCGIAQGAEFLASAIEMIHCYSLIHDDLPAMDNSDLRRGRPSLHKEFDEATAILAGDSLLTASFELVAHHSPLPPAITVELIASLARAAGGMGMCGGQSLDILAQAKTEAQITQLQKLKTGALIEFATISGAIMVGDSGPRRKALQNYAESLGLAFQIADDILDAIGDSAVIGKSAGLDARDGKVNFITILGVAGARERSQTLVEGAKESLAIFGAEAKPLCDLADFTLTRDH